MIMMKMISVRSLQKHNEERKPKGTEHSVSLGPQDLVTGRKDHQTLLRIHHILTDHPMDHRDHLIQSHLILIFHLLLDHLTLGHLTLGHLTLDHLTQTAGHQAIDRLGLIGHLTQTDLQAIGHLILTIDLQVVIDRRIREDPTHRLDRLIGRVDSSGRMTIGRHRYIHLQTT